MKRFLMLVGVAVVAAAMYVAASPASQQSKAPTGKQFRALQKKVTALSKTLKTVKSEANAAVGFIASCLVSTNAGALPVNQFGDSSAGSTVGYRFFDGTNDSFTSALDVDGTTTNFTGVYLQGVDPTCVTAALRHRAPHAGSSLQLRGERLH
jgi:hypothetical protein